MSSPAERYAQFRNDQKFPMLSAFKDILSFELDDFQVRGCQALEQGHGVLVAAPTGAGKTVVGEFAVFIALATGRKCFYTTPIKALSNQKFSDLVAVHGAENVGLLTGDNSVNSEAPIVVMTTEVLRNMIYAGSATLTGLSHVVMDEVHYLADRFRGAVWEEVIIGLPESVSIVSLSATVSNVEEFGEWLTTVRGDTVVVLEERRPVPLQQHVLVGRNLYPLFETDAPGESRVNRNLERMARDDAQWRRAFDKNRSHTRGKGGKRPRSRHRTPDRVDMVTQLESAGLLPAICFIFSRNGCATAVEQCLHANLRLTTPTERDEILARVDEACAHLPPADLDVLGFESFRAALGRGIAAHHAGMLPTFKEIVEDLFCDGLVKIVFATETLALGINMPARSVVIEKLTKWNGETHVTLSPGEYTQLTGRAGRRGIDIEGHGVVLWQAGLEPAKLAGLASTRTYPLTSSFKPSYNMAVNLIPQLGRDTTRRLLEQSFAQFQADRSVVGIARKVAQADEALAGYSEAATCHLGDFSEYAALRRELSQVESQGAKFRRSALKDEAIESLRAVRRGEIIRVPAGKYAGLALILDPGPPNDPAGPRPMVLTEGRHVRRLSIVDFPRPVVALGSMKIPKHFNPRVAAARRDLASALIFKGRDLPHHNEPNRGPRELAPDPRISLIRKQLGEHPCHECPDRETHARWFERWYKLESDTVHNRRRIAERTNSIARQFDRVCAVLDELGYLAGDEVTDKGMRLQRIYGDLDLLVAECLDRRLWDALKPSELAAVASGMTFESRMSDEPPPPRMPNGKTHEVAQQMLDAWGEIDQLERRHKVGYGRRPDFTFASAVFVWCEGASLDVTLSQADIAAGDFVRAIKQLIDLVAQIASATESAELRSTARKALDGLRRGVIEQSTAIG